MHGYLTQHLFAQNYLQKLRTAQLYPRNEFHISSSGCYQSKLYRVRDFSRDSVHPNGHVLYSFFPLTRKIKRTHVAADLSSLGAHSKTRGVANRSAPTQHTIMQQIESEIICRGGLPRAFSPLISTPFESHRGSRIQIMAEIRTP